MLVFLNGLMVLFLLVITLQEGNMHNLMALVIPQKSYGFGFGILDYMIISYLQFSEPGMEVPTVAMV